MTDAVRYPVVELRQYTLRPGQRDVLIDLFDREQNRVLPALSEMTTSLPQLLRLAPTARSLLR